MKASVIILAWNGVHYLPACLDSLQAQDYHDFEVIVVDNASSDGSPELVSSHYPWVKLLQNKSNLGFAGGNNIGLETASGEVLVLLNQDTWVRKSWLSSLVAGLGADSKVGVAGCKILYPDEKLIQHAGGIIRPPRGIPDHHGYRQPDDGNWDSPRDVDYVTGAALALRRDVLQVIGYLDEGFFPAYFEDADLCARARSAGYRVVYVPDAVLVHVESTSLGWNSPTYSGLMHHGRLRYLLKHTSPETFIQQTFPAERAWLHTLQLPSDRVALWSAYQAAGDHLNALIEEDKFIQGNTQDWQNARPDVENALKTLREQALQIELDSSYLPEGHAAQAQFLLDHLCGQLQGKTAYYLAKVFIPNELLRWNTLTAAQQEILIQLYKEFEVHVGPILSICHPGELLLAEACWNESLANLEPGNIAQPTGFGSMQTELASLKEMITTLETSGHFHDHVFDSRVPVIGPLISWTRRQWYNVAARWAIQSLKAQQDEYNHQLLNTLDEIRVTVKSLEQQISTTQYSVIQNDRAIVQFGRQLAVLEQALKQKDDA